MRRITIALTALMLMGNTLACCCIAPPNIHIDMGPTVEVGTLQEKDETIPLGETESATVEILFGAGELEIAAGDSEQLLVGHFLYNVEEWEPEISYENHKMTIQQGDSEDDWGWPTGDSAPRNEWELEFSPDVSLAIDIKAGAGQGNLDFTGLQLEALDIDMGAGDFTIRFDEPSEIRMNRFTLDAGAGKLDVIGVGNASPEEMVVQGGAGDITLDLTGDWSRSADIEVTAGVGELTLRLPDDVGVRVEVEGGLSSVTASGLQKSGGAYVNDAYGESESELNIQVTTGIGEINLRVTD